MPIIIVLAVIALSVTTVLVFKSFLSPASLMTLLWGSFIVACIVALNPYDWNYWGLIWIMAAVISFSIGFWLFSRSHLKGSSSRRDVNTVMNRKASSVFLLGSIALSLVYVVLLLARYGYTFSMLFNFETLMEINKQTAKIRYYGNMPYSYLLQSLLVFVYASNLLGGYSFVYADSLALRMLSLAAILPEMLVLLIDNTKAGLIGCIILWASGFFVASYERFGHLPKVSRKTLMVLASTFAVFIMTMYFSMMLRIGTFSASTFRIVNKKMVSYALGHIPAFDHWFGNMPKDLPYSMGGKTFIGPLNFIGIGDRVQGIYSDGINNGIINTNVFTIFRGIIEDFGIFGGCVFLLFFGAIGGLSYRFVLVNKSRIPVAQTLLSFIYSFILFFPVAITSYLTFVMAFGLFFFYLLAVKNMQPISRSLHEIESRLNDHV